MEHQHLFTFPPGYGQFALGIFDDARGLAVAPKKELVTEFLVDNQMLRRTRPSRR